MSDPKPIPPVALSDETTQAVTDFLTAPNGPTAALFFRAVAWCVHEMRTRPESLVIAAIDPDPADVAAAAATSPLDGLIPAVNEPAAFDMTAAGVYDGPRYLRVNDPADVAASNVPAQRTAADDKHTPQWPEDDEANAPPAEPPANRPPG